VDGSKCPVDIVGGVPIVTAPEEIDVTNAPFLRSAMLEAAAHGDGTLVVDMTLTRFCDSSGLHALLAAHRRAQAGGGGLFVVADAPAILRVFALTGVDSLIPRFSSLNDALAQAAPEARPLRQPG
jgi:anti-sigma B factor antagonist